MKFKDFLYVYCIISYHTIFTMLTLEKNALKKSTFSSCVKWMLGYMSTIMFASAELLSECIN